ncbi:MAG: hypothetical protein ACRDAX_01410 [Propionibacteriaceae bacterium]
MKDTMWQTVVAALLVAGFVAIPINSQATTPAEMASIALPKAQNKTSISLIVTTEAGGFINAQGTLSDNAGRPIPNATLVLTFDGVEVAHPVTQADGSWNQPLGSDGQNPRGANRFRISYGGDAKHAPIAVSGSLQGGLAVADNPSPTPTIQNSKIEANLTTPDVIAGDVIVIQGHLKTEVPLAGQLVNVALDGDKTPVGNALSGPDGSFSISIGAPVATEPRSLAIHVTFAGVDGITGTDTVLSASLKPAPPKPSTTPTQTATPTASPSQTPTPTPTIAAIASSTQTSVPSGKLPSIPIPYVVALIATLAGAVGVAATAFFARGDR